MGRPEQIESPGCCEHDSLTRRILLRRHGADINPSDRPMRLGFSRRIGSSCKDRLLLQRRAEPVGVSHPETVTIDDDTQVVSHLKRTWSDGGHFLSSRAT